MIDTHPSLEASGRKEEQMPGNEFPSTLYDTKKEPPPSEDGSSSCLLSHHSAPIAGTSARLWVPDSVLHTLPRTGEGRFSSHYRLLPQTRPDMLLKHPELPIPHLHQWGTSGRYPMPFPALNGAVLPASIKMIGEPFFQPLSGISLRPPQTCFRTCGYLFRALQ